MVLNILSIILGIIMILIAISLLDLSEKKESLSLHAFIEFLFIIGFILLLFGSVGTAVKLT